MKERIVNATITETFFGPDDHAGNLTFFLRIQVENSPVSATYGGYSLSGWDPLRGVVGYSEKGLEAMARIIETVGAGSWEVLPNTKCRIKADYKGEIIAIAHKYADNWFSLQEFYKKAG